MSKLPLTETWIKQNLISSDSREHKELKESVASLACCLAKSRCPSTLYSRQIQISCHGININPRYQLLTSKQFTTVALPWLASKIRGNIECKIRSKQTFCSYLSLICAWIVASRDQCITLACHFIDCSWELKSLCLQTHYILENHTTKNTSELLAKTLQLHKLEYYRLVGITTNKYSSSNIKLASELPSLQ